MKNNTSTELEFTDLEMVSGGDILDVTDDVLKIPERIIDDAVVIWDTIWDMF